MKAEENVVTFFETDLRVPTATTSKLVLMDIYVAWRLFNKNNVCS